jgi:flagellar secretion chaperone FliS
MSYTNGSSTYRQVEVLSASPAQLVVIVYDYLLVQLCRAVRGVETKDIELRSDAMSRCNAAVTELLSGLDTERGGAIGKQLESLYMFYLGEFLSIGRKNDLKNDLKLLNSIRAQVTELRTAFAEIASRPNASAA